MKDTVVELRTRLGDLERRYLGTTVPTPPSKTPFAPTASVVKKVEELVSVSLPPSDRQATTKLPILKLPEFTGVDLEDFLDEFGRWLRLSGVQHENEQTKLDWLLESCSHKIKPVVKKLIKEHNDLGEVLHRMSKLFPKLENDLSLRQKLDKISPLPHSPEPSQVAQLYVDLEELLGKMTLGSMSDQEKFILLSRKLHPKTFAEMRSDRHFKRRTESFEDLKSALLEKAEEDWLERNLLQLKRENVHTLQDGQSQPAQKTQTQTPKPFGKGRGKGGKGKGQGGGNPQKNPRSSKICCDRELQMVWSKRSL